MCDLEQTGSLFFFFFEEKREEMCKKVYKVSQVFAEHIETHAHFSEQA